MPSQLPSFRFPLKCIKHTSNLTRFKLNSSSPPTNLFSPAMFLNSLMAPQWAQQLKLNSASHARCLPFLIPSVQSSSQTCQFSCLNTSPISLFISTSINTRKSQSAATPLTGSLSTQTCSSHILAARPQEIVLKHKSHLPAPPPPRASKVAHRECPQTFS